MRFLRPLAVPLVIGLTVFVSSSGGRAQAPLVTAFYGIGDLPTGTAGAGSAVRDATRVNGVLYAVGSTAAGNAIVCTNAPGTPATPAGCQVPPIYNLDTPVLWTKAGGVAGTLTALPPGPAFPDQNLPGAPGTPATAYALTPGADFIASQAHFSSDITNTGATWTRVAISALPGSGANSLPGGSGFAALAISGDGPGGVVDGNVMYGQTFVTGNSSLRTAARYDFGTGTYAQLPFPAGLGYSNVWTVPVPRGTSEDGNVMMGIAGPNGISGTPAGVFPQATIADAFRYVEGSGSTLIPKLTGGNWNFPIAVSADGNIMLLAGNSTNFPNGEVYLRNAATSAVTTLGSPNTAWTPRILGGMTADGVVAVTFASGAAGGPGAITGLGIPPGANSKYGYLRNSRGWFHLANALAAQNIDLAAQGWDPTNIAITGVRTVDGMDLVFGQGRRRSVGLINGLPGFVDGAAEGFVAEFPAGYLASYAHPAPAPPGNAAIIGAWGLGNNANTASIAYFFLADGTYYQVSTGGFERGFYAYDADYSYRIWTRQDADGPAISSNNGKLGRSVTIVGDTLTIADANCPGCGQTTMTRVPPGAGTLIGGWVLGDPTTDDGSGVGMFTGTPTGGKYFFASDFEEQDDQSEVGTWSFDGTTLALSAITGNRNGAQFTISNNSQPAQLTADDLGLVITDPQINEVFTLKRIVDPSTVVPVITNATFAASGTEDAAFSFTVTAINALTYSATGLPTGVTINADTGVISGTPAVNGTFNVQVTVTNTLGSTTTRTLVLTVAAPAASMRGIGDLAGGNFGSAVRDATRVNGAIYAVGASVVNLAVSTNFDLDTPALWTYTGGASGTLTALPYASGVINNNTAARTAYAISSLDGNYIASQAQFTNSDTNIGTRWVRVDRSLVPNPTANLDISSVGGVPVAFAALSISETGDVLYGQGTNADTTRTPRRYQAGLIQTVDISATGKTWAFPTPRGTSADGSVMVGAASNGAFAGTNTSAGPFGYNILGTNSVAFRYAYNANTQTGTTSVIPFAPGGTWNFPIAVSDNGGETVVAGNSTAYPNGEIYLTNAANIVTAALGSPNTAFTPRLLGGRTDDGAIVVTFVNLAQGGFGQIAGLQLPSSQRIVYLHNGNGWFLLGSVLRQQGLDLEALGWNANLLTVTGVHTVEGVDLVFGQGVRRSLNPATGVFTDGAPEGFVIELPAGTLANFNPTVTPPADDALVGGWITGNQANPSGVTVYLSDGRYVSLTQGGSAYQNGSERGSYAWAANGGDFYATTRVDHNAQFGLQSFSVLQGRTMTVTGDLQSIYNTHCDPGLANCTINTPRLVGDQSSIVGAWTATIPSGPYAGAVITAAFLGQAQGYRYLVDYDTPGSDDDFELGTYTFTPGTLTTTRDGGGGVPEAGGAVLSRDGLQMVVQFDDDFYVTFDRVVRPATVVPVITSPLTATGTLTQPFSYTIAATYGLTFGATGLPDGLSIDADTGVISGVPTTLGTTAVTLSATNTLGAQTTAQLVITVVKATQDTLSVVAPGSKPYGSQFAVSSSGGSGNGAVTFFATDGCSVLGTTVTMTSGTVNCVLSATKDGDDVYDPAVSQSVTVTAERVAASVTPNAATKVYGTADPVFSGTVAGFLPSDNVTATYSRTAGETVNGGPYTISATLAPSGVLSNYLITYNTANFTITKAGSGTAVVSSQGSTVYGQSVTFTATVSSSAGTPTGTVTFFDGATLIGSASLNASGVATLTTAALPAGAHTISATYGGADDYSGSSNSTSQSVATATTATALSSSPNPSSPGQTVTFVATVTSQYSGLVTGTVSFKKGQQILGTAAVQANGTATFPLSTLGNGSTIVTAIYSGDGNNVASTSSPITQNVVPPAAPTTTTLVSSLNPAVIGQSVTLTASVSSGTAGTITGTVDFKRGQTVLFTAPLVNGQASYPTTTLPQGTLSLTATYSGDAQYIASTSAVLSQVVTQATTSTTLVSSPNPSAGGQIVTLTATISPSTLVTPISGTVTFRRGSTVLGTAAVSGGQAVLTTTTLPAGASNLTAIYGGDATYSGSTSTAISHTVLTGTTTTSLTSSLNPSTFGTEVTFTATVVSSVPGSVLTGSVEFLEGSTTLGTGTLDATGHATFSTSSLALKNGKAMTHNLKAKYLGDVYNGTSTSATYAQVVNP